MEEEKKKASRPTWAMVKELEKELAELKEKHRLQLLADKHMAEELQEMEQQMSLCKSELSLTHQIADSRAREIERLRERGLWDRIFNN